jgi:hypothetical protein
MITQEQQIFLMGYCPKNNIFTSNEECDLIIDKFNMKSLSLKELSELRNEVVKFYTLLRRQTNKDYMQSMQSVTSVIDYLPYK